MIKTIKDIFDYREMIFSLVRRDLRGRYRASVLGFLWTFINPFMQLVIYTVVFSVIMRAGIENYYLFLFVALIPWIFFSGSVVGGTMCIVGQSSMVTKIKFPREVLPISFVTSQFVNMLLSFIVVFIVLVSSNQPISLIVLPMLIPIMILEYMLSLGIVMIVAPITVYFRDMEHIISIITMGWQFLTPVMYSVDMVPESIRGVFMINPMTPIIVAYRDILYYGKFPELVTLQRSFIMAIVCLIIGCFVFSKLKRHFAEEL